MSLLLLLACARSAAPVAAAEAPQTSAAEAVTATPDPYVAEVDAWHAARVERLRAPDGWLSLIGLHWLDEGAQTLGSTEAADVQLAAPRLPADLGSITRTGADLELSVVSGLKLTVNEAPVAGQRALATDADGAPDVVRIDGVMFYGIARGERVGLRVKDTQSELLTSFAGIERYDVASDWRVRAELRPHPAPVEIMVPNVLGDESAMATPGRLHFELAGQAYTLDPVGEPDDLFIVYGDETNGLQTYGGGRFLSAKVEEDGRTVWLDFNQSVNPPCAFTNFATCPLPPDANKLALAVEAGERNYGDH